MYSPCLLYYIYLNVSFQDAHCMWPRNSDRCKQKLWHYFPYSSSFFLFLHFYCEICHFSIENDISVPLFLSRHVRNLQASWKSGPKRFLAFFIHNIIFYVLREYDSICMCTDPVLADGTLLFFPLKSISGRSFSTNTIIYLWVPTMYNNTTYI